MEILSVAFGEKKKIMLHFMTLSIDVCVFLDYNRQKEGNCK